MQIETDFDYVILLHTWHGRVHCLSTGGGSLLEWAVPCVVFKIWTHADIFSLKII